MKRLFLAFIAALLAISLSGCFIVERDDHDHEHHRDREEEHGQMLNHGYNHG
ncbi:MAG: hypothetical protein ABSG42_02740 [Nitrospirota bacterium]